jgi:hypothetical protein
VVAFAAILVTGRYPRPIFEFNVGVLRWTWRVSAYCVGVLGTDRYPPFTLAEADDYPARLAIEYPDRLSRGLVLVKWWLLALPHLLVVGVLAGGAWVAWSADRGAWVVYGGLIGILVLFAAVALAATGRYPSGLFDLILGLNRWVLRVGAYVGLMTDRYPPFRLDLGGTEPPGTLSVPTSPEAPTRPSADLPEPPGPRRDRGSGWSGLRVISLVFGVLLGLVSLGALGAGAVGLWADRTQRDAQGFVQIAHHEYATEAYALVTENIDVGQGEAAFFPRGILDRLRIEAAPTLDDTRLFVGIAPADEVRRYLAGSRHAVVVDFGDDAQRIEGGGRPEPPASQPFWTESAVGAGSPAVEWSVARGSWAIVVMNADASANVAVDAAVGASIPDLLEIAIALLVVGGLALTAAVLLIVVPIRRVDRGW